MDQSFLDVNLAPLRPPPNQRAGQPILPKLSWRFFLPFPFLPTEIPAIDLPQHQLYKFSQSIVTASHSRSPSSHVFPSVHSGSRLPSVFHFFHNTYERASPSLQPNLYPSSTCSHSLITLPSKSVSISYTRLLVHHPDLKPSSN